MSWKKLLAARKIHTHLSFFHDTTEFRAASKMVYIRSLLTFLRNGRLP
jgi:hypothetical protein